MKNTILAFILVAFNLQFTQAQVSHEPWNDLLKKYVSAAGKVDYKGIHSERAKLEGYLKTISENSPTDEWSENQKLAYWINAYNGFAVKLIVDNYPLKSIQDLHPTIKIPGISTVWKKEFFKIEDVDFSLHQIEHKILRKDFEEPRIHFTINCASVSCPKLRNEAYTAEKVQDQMEDQAKDFVNDKSKNKISANEVEISNIFNWFKGDFENDGDIIDFLNKYSKVKINKKAKVDYMYYNWSLNE
ncbi:MAG: hypothetical protein ACJAWV_001310 [Flammeovirgaceae bacterium]|jgi:hypothetical protein